MGLISLRFFILLEYRTGQRARMRLGLATSRSLVRIDPRLPECVGLFLPSMIEKAV
jgi:hypothetical protein